MMETAKAVDIAWLAIEKRQRPPPELAGALSAPQAYEVQMAILDRHLASGQRLAGWKIGGNSAFGRKTFGDLAPFSGFLLESGRFAAGHAFEVARLPGAAAVIESELVVEFGKRLAGVVSREQLFDAIESITAAYEVAVTNLGKPLDLPQLFADDAAQWAYVMGDRMAVEKDFDFTTVEISAWRNGELFESAIARDKVDDQAESIIWLAAHLERLGKAIEPGHLVLSGACLTPAPLTAGQTWKTTFTPGGEVSASFV